MTRMLVSDVVDLWFESHSCQLKTKIGIICCFLDTRVVLRSKIKDGLAWNPDNVCEWGDMSIHGLFCQ